MAKVLEWKVPFKRIGNFPLDIDSVFNSKVALDAYVKNEGTSAHVGQVVAVVDNEVCNIYKIVKVGENGLTVKLYDESDIDDIRKDLVTESELTGYTKVAEFNTLTNTVNSKQDAINDLDDIRNNVKSGVTAYEWGNHADEGYIKVVDILNEVNEETDSLEEKVVSAKYVTDKLNSSFDNIVAISGTLNTVSEKLDEVSSSITNFSLFNVVTALPEKGNTNKIYLIPDGDFVSGNTGNTFTEYIYITEKTNDGKEYSYWEILGQYTINNDIDLTEYVKRNELDNYTKKSELDNYAKKSELDNYTKKTDLTGFTTKDEYQTLSNKYSDLSDKYTELSNTCSGLLSRIEALESIISGATDSMLITTENIKDHAITKIVSVDDDINITNDEGVATIKLVKISNNAIEQ